MSTNTSDHTLLLQRHAKAEHVPGKDDIERELTAKGRRDAAAAGEWLTQQSIEVGLVLCSTAVRATQTWQAAASAGAQAEKVRYDDRLYDAGVGTLLDVVQEVEDTAGVVLLVGHAPGIPAFAT